MTPEEKEAGREPLFPKNKKPSIFRHIRWKVEAARTFTSNVPANMKMICEWVPVLWDNWDWDYNFLLKIMQYKMQRMANHIREHNILVRSEEIADELQECCDIITRLQAQEYTPFEEGVMEAEYGKHCMDSLPCEHEGCRQLDIYFDKAREEGREEEADAVYTNIRNLAMAREQRDYHRLFTLMRDKIQGWWD